MTNIFIQIVVIAAALCVNLYLVASFLFDSDLRELKNYPIFFVSLTDFLVTGPGFASLVCSQHFIQPHFGFLDGFNNVSWLNDIRSIVRPFISRHIVANFSWFWYICVPELLTQRLNEYSNGPCAVLLAYQRYIMVCKPHEKDFILTKKFRQRSCFALTFIILTMMTIDGFIRYLTYDFNCSAGFKIHLATFSVNKTRLISSTISTALFSIIPAIFCICCYYKTASILFKRKKKVGRNLNLIMCFAMICGIWLFTLFVRYGFYLYTFFIKEYTLPRKLHQYPIARNMQLKFLLNNFSGFSSVCNPFLILLGQRDYREPFFKLINQMKKIGEKSCRRNNE